MKAFQENVPPFIGGEVTGNTGPDELACGISHLAGDDEALFSGLFHHLMEKVVIELLGGVFYGETRVSISVRFNF